ncbi:hypothetical protein G9A89_013797 [Geosiphon pyriformis]|nr:hypothetical protein G9A89_013797 [Geosiphon pyriformis]
MTSGNSRFRVTQNWRLAMVVYQPILSLLNKPSGSRQWSSGTGYNQNPSFQNYLSLLVSPKDTAPSIQKTNQKTLTNNILPTTISHNELLTMIFLFELEEPSIIPLFSGAALEEKLITTMYMNVKVDGQFIKLILDSESVGSIITKQLMNQLANGATKTPISEINDLLIEINGIIMPIKVLVIEATQYQALIGNDWLSKTNALTHVVRKGERKPTWEAYQDINNNWETNEDQEEVINWEWKKNKNEKGKGKAKEKESTSTDTYTTYTHPLPQPTNYCQPKLICIDYGKKLSSMGTCCGDDEKYPTAIKFYCCPCVVERFGQPKRQRKWDNQSCLTYRETLLDEGMWNDIPE